MALVRLWLTLWVAFCLLVSAAAYASDSAVLFEHVQLFDGKSDRLLPGTHHVLVVGNGIEQISRNPIDLPEDSPALRIDGRGHTLMPGLIDAHWHSMLVGAGMLDTMTAEVGYLNIKGARVAEATLLRGFTSVRDMGGPAMGLHRAIEEGLIRGPRIFPSGAMISQTGGHADFRLPTDIPRASNQSLSHPEQMRAAAIADGVDEVLRRVREQLMLGATQIKLTAGGGVSSMYDPLDVTQYTLDEMRAAVAAAENWGTYVTVHAYTSRAVQQAIEAGVKVIEHGQLIDEATVRLMARQGIWWSLQPFLDNELANPKTGESRLKQLMVSQGTDRAYELAKKHRVKVAFGTDILFTGDDGHKQNLLLNTLARWYSPGEVLKMATGDNGQLLALTGPRNPYRRALGVIETDAMADLILVKGDPTSDLSLVTRPDENFVVIMKNGRIYKNSL
ncbi:MAG: amidohydrolase family protein [Marinobacter sp.]|nr:amidohydrolase family protein [Marinobacter sp.]